MATITKTEAQSLIALQEVSAAPRVVISSVLDVATKLGALICIHFGRTVTTALTAGVRFRIEASAKASGNDAWFPLHVFQTGLATAESEAVSGTAAAGATAIGAVSTTNLTAGDVIFIKNGTIGNSEWARIAAVTTNTSVTVEEGITNAQTGATMYDQGEIFSVPVDCTAVKRLRVVADGSGAGQNYAVEVLAVTGDSIG